MNRRSFVRVSTGAALLQLAAAPFRLVGAANATLTPPPGLVNVRARGLRGDGKNDDSDALVAMLRREPGGKFFFPSGTYRIDNTPKPGHPLRVNGRIQIDYFSGTLWFAQGARLLFTRQNTGGLIFNGGEGAKFYNLALGYSVAPSIRLFDHSALFFNRTSRTLIEGCESLYSPGSGIVFWACFGPSLHAATVRGSAADGVHFASCADPRAVGIRTFDTGDDGLAFVSYKGENRLSGGYANDIKVYRSRARGIAVVGQHGVLVENFLVDGTASSGVLIGNDAYADQQPHAVTVRDGLIKNVGRIQPNLGNQDGIEIYAATRATVDNVSIAAVPNSRSGEYSMRRGVNAYCLPGTALSPLGGTVELTRIAVSGGQSGAELRANQLFLGDADHLRFGLSVEETDRYGIFIADSPRASAWDLRLRNVSRRAPPEIAGRALWFENNASLTVNGVALTDARSPPTGYVVGFWREASSAASQTGSVRRIRSNLGASLQVQRSRLSKRLLVSELPVTLTLID
jgi:hypothetical protein